jgi:hypothetical protein
VNEHCQADPNGIPKAIGLWLDIMISFYAMIKGLIGIAVETPWVGKILDPSYQGYLWKKTLAGICTADTDMRWFKNKLNDKFRRIFTAINGETIEEYNEFIPAIGPAPPAATEPEAVTQQRTTVYVPNPNTVESENPQTRTDLYTSGTVVMYDVTRVIVSPAPAVTVPDTPAVRIVTVNPQITSTVIIPAVPNMPLVQTVIVTLTSMITIWPAVIALHPPLSTSPTGVRSRLSKQDSMCSRPRLRKTLLKPP